MGRLYPLLEEGQNQFLLPVCNRPLLSYAIETLLDKSGLSEIIVVTTSEKDLADVTGRVNEAAGKRFTLVTVPAGTNSVTALLECAHLIYTDFFVVSGDLVCDISLQPMIMLHQLHDAAVTVLLSEKHEEATGKKGQHRGLEDYIAFENQEMTTGASNPPRLLYLKERRNLGDNFYAPYRMLSKFPNFSIRADVRDCYCYLFAPWVLDLARAHPSFEDVKDDLLTHVLKLSWKMDPEDEKFIPKRSQHIALSYSSSSTAFEEDDKVRCLYFSTKGHTRRIRTLPVYQEVNLLVSKSQLKFNVRSVPVTHAGDARPPVGDDCFSAANVRVGEKSLVKKSVIGSHTVIGKSCKILNSIIMDHVTIGDNVVLMSSLVSPNVFIGDKSDLTNVQVTRGMEVPADSKVSNSAYTRQSMDSEMDVM